MRGNEWCGTKLLELLDSGVLIKLKYIVASLTSLELRLVSGLFYLALREMRISIASVGSLAPVLVQ